MPRPDTRTALTQATASCIRRRIFIRGHARLLAAITVFPAHSVAAAASGIVVEEAARAGSAEFEEFQPVSDSFARIFPSEPPEQQKTQTFAGWRF